MTNSWLFPSIEPYRVQGRGLAEDNFASEDRRNEEILGREAYQNALDARSAGNSGAVRVALRVLDVNEIDVNYLKSILPPEYEARHQAATDGASKIDFTTARVLIVEDFGTTGLEGTFVDSTKDGNRENWNAFWFREGEGAKSGASSNGRAGQGKVTFYRVGELRALFGLTVRQSDSKSLLFGRSSFRRNYFYKDRKYERDSFWCQHSANQILPTESSIEIEAFRSAFKLLRTIHEPGLSLVIPFQVTFDINELVTTAISDFYLPIARGRLEVQIGGELITASNLDAKADELLSDEIARDKRSSFSKGFRSMVRHVLKNEIEGKPLILVKPGWEKSSNLKEDSLPDGALTELRSTLDRGDLVSVTFPVTVRPKRGESIETRFEVHMELPEQLDRVEEAYVRGDLLIGSETHLASSSYLPRARGLTLIADDGLSAFLADAEEPTHLKWNGSRPRLAEDYKSPKDLVRAVRHGLPRLLALLIGGNGKRDVKALAKYFTTPAEIGRKHEPGGRIEGVDTIPIVEVPEPRKKPLKLETGTNWVEVRPNGPNAILNDLPIQCELETAYEGLDQDPFGAYDPFDFDLSDSDTYEITSRGVSLLETNNNQVRFEITDEDFELRVGGFDSNIRLRARLTYKEEEDGATIDPE